ncbi:MAG: hypothetical protein ABI877_00685 [Gemmatimonadaceae bacterium]
MHGIASPDRPIASTQEGRNGRDKSWAIPPNHFYWPFLPNLLQSREAFIAHVKRYVSNVAERKRLTEVLDHFIDWSFKHPAELSHYDGDHDSHVVSFKRQGDGAVLWSAHPRRDDGAKLEILPGGHSSLSAERLQDALTVIHSVTTREPVVEETTLRIPFVALKSEMRRDHVTALLERILSDPVKPGIAHGEARLRPYA